MICYKERLDMDDRSMSDDSIELIASLYIPPDATALMGHIDDNHHPAVSIPVNIRFFFLLYYSFLSTN